MQLPSTRMTTMLQGEENRQGWGKGRTQCISGTNFARCRERVGPAAAQTVTIPKTARNRLDPRAPVSARVGLTGRHLWSAIWIGGQPYPRSKRRHRLEARALPLHARIKTTVHTNERNRFVPIVRKVSKLRSSSRTHRRGAGSNGGRRRRSGSQSENKFAVPFMLYCSAETEVKNVCQAPR